MLDHIFTAINLRINNLRIKTNLYILSIPISIEYELLNKYSPDVTIVLMANIHELKRRWMISDMVSLNYDTYCCNTRF